MRDVSTPLDMTSESFRMPVRLGEGPFAFVFEEFVNRRQNNACAFGTDADVEIEFVVEKIDVATSEHIEKFSGHIEILGMNDSVLDRNGRSGVASDAVAGAWHHVIQDSRERAKD